MNIKETIATAAKRGAHNPFPGAKVRSNTWHIGEDDLEICDDPVSTKRSYPSKYEGIIKQMIPGQAIRCPPTQVNRVAGALRKYIIEHKWKANVKTTRDYGDGYGRVWLLSRED